MIEATVNEGKVKCHIQGRGTCILAELTVLVDSICDKIAGDDKESKKLAIKAICANLHCIN